MFTDLFNEFGVAVADVAGKGAPAALLTAVLQGVFASQASSGSSPAVTLSKGAFDLMLRYEISLMGSWNSMSAPFPGDEWRTVVDLFASGRLNGLETITDEVGVSDVPALIPRLADRSEFHLKALVYP